MITTKEMLHQMLGDSQRWRSSTEVGLLLDSAAKDHKAVAAKARVDEKCFAAFDGAIFHYPAFQFDEQGIGKYVAELVRVLPRDSDQTVSTEAALWCFAPDSALGGRTPAVVFGEDPNRVIALAQVRRHGGDYVE